jgi:HEAT repeat protein
MSRRLKSLTADDVIRLLLVAPSDSRPATKILSRVGAPVIIEAIRIPASAPVRAGLCDVLGFRHEPTAVPVLVEMLDDPDPGVRSAAADALAKIGNPEAGPALEDRFRTELSSEVRSMLAAALGAVGRTQAISLLIESLNDPWEVLRGCAAWSLGHLKALEAEDALTQAVKREQNAYSKTQLERALSEMRSERRRQARAEVSRKTTRGSVRRRAR